ncbi:hypothetical protein G6F57_021834 [Rhizopus arrhizus]|nr:hypothetical protein G6F31_021565 [Rhizopus arrhizus]KAG1433944.1 hypothetical protein G6F57_021834 [Rhizopus arrhizus]
MSSSIMRDTASAWSSASRCATRAPRSCASTSKRSWPSARITAIMSAAIWRLEWAEWSAVAAGLPLSP